MSKSLPEDISNQGIEEVFYIPLSVYWEWYRATVKYRALHLRSKGVPLGTPFLREHQKALDRYNVEITTH